MTGLSLLKVDQAWEPFRADPRFVAVDDLKNRSLFQAIDTAVSQRDQNLKKTRSS